METREMIAFLKHINDDFYGQREHFKFTSQDADTIYEIALRMETMLEKLDQGKQAMTGYLFLNSEIKYESEFSFDKGKYEGDGWYIAAEVSTLTNLILELENAGFDYDYIQNFINMSLSHDDYNILTQKGNQLWNT